MLEAKCERVVEKKIVDGVEKLVVNGFVCPGDPRLPDAFPVRNTPKYESTILFLRYQKKSVSECTRRMPIRTHDGEPCSEEEARAEEKYKKIVKMINKGYRDLYIRECKKRGIPILEG